MQLTSAQKTLLKNHLLANTNLITVQSDPAIAINASPGVLANDPTYQTEIAKWYNATATPGENQPFATPLEVWHPALDMQSINAGISFGTLIPHDLGGSPTVTEQYLARIYKLLFFQTLTWNSKIDMTDAQQRAGIFNTFGNSPNTTTDGIAAIGRGRKTGTRMERLFAGSAVGQAGIGGAIGRVPGLDLQDKTTFGQSLTQTDIATALAS